MKNNNPLLQEISLPRFSQIQACHVEPAINSIIKSNREQLEQLLTNTTAKSWDTIVRPLEEMDNRLNRAWSPVRHLNSVMSSDEMSQAHDLCLPSLSDYSTDLGQNKKLFDQIKALRKSDTTLNDTQKKILDDMVLNFTLSGVALPTKDQQRYKQCQRELSELASTYEQNILKSRDAWSLNITDKRQLQGLPAAALEMLADSSSEVDNISYRLSLQMPCYIAVMTHADDRSLRKKMYDAYITRASDQGPHAGQWDNSPLMEKILARKLEAAKLLGYVNIAEKSLATKMADSTEQVLRFLEDLAQRAKPAAKKELETLQDFANEELKGEQLQPWDVAYYGEKLRQQQYDFSQETLKPWFSANNVVHGLFKIVQQLYNIEIRQNKKVECWHPDVQFYDITDANGQLRGQFYLDLYARPKKRGGAWMDDCQTRFMREQGLQTPVAYLVCNATPPINNKPALLTHEEVITLFHEFGHGLHHMLTLVDYPSAAGINGVEWDAVELPSQFMENFCWQRESLDLFARHYETNETIPEDTFAKMQASRHFHAALQMVRQVELSLFDLRMHMETEPPTINRIQAILESVRKEVAVITPPNYARFQHSFSHIFAGGYAAGYYSYKWAEVLSADAFSLFEEKGVLDKSTGEKFLHCILEKGGSEKAMKLFTAFRGREPNINALLRHNGLMT